MSDRKDPADPLLVMISDFEEFKPAAFIFPGVYVFRDKKGHFVYIGESKNIPQRLKQHKKKKWFSEELDVTVLWCADAEARLTAETAMILRYRPRENKAIKIGLSKTGGLYPLNFLRTRSG
jgi:excinuclease UvrABC nuclease subunit